MSEARKETMIVSADDYGIREADVPMLSLAEQGKLDRVAVLVRYVDGSEAEALAKTGVKMDIHLDLVRLLEAGETEHAASGSRIVNFLMKVCSGQASPAKAKEEWREQIELFRKIFGRLPDGLNSHEHVHFFPPYFRVFLELAKEYGIREVRFGKKGMWGGSKRRHVRWILSVLHYFDRSIWEKEKEYFETTDFIGNYDWFASDKELLSKLPEDGTFEVVFHPERPREYDHILNIRK